MSNGTGVQSPLNLMLTIQSGQNLAILEYLAKNSATIDAGLTAVGTVHFARFLYEPGFVANPPTSQTLWVITEYDGSFDVYIQDFVAQMGPIFDALLAFAVGAPPLPVEQNIQAFLNYVNANNVPSGLYAAYPSCTVQQIWGNGCAQPGSGD